MDPCPEVFDAIVQYAEQGANIVSIASDTLRLASLAQQIATYHDVLRNAASKLAQMARAQLAGQPLTTEQLAFINDAVRVDRQVAGCVTIDVPNGWYAKLFFQPEKVLHVGTGYPRYMVATFDTCQGPRAYAGVVFAYHEKTTENFLRLTDREWSQNFVAGAVRPTDVPWITPVLAQ